MHIIISSGISLYIIFRKKVMFIRIINNLNIHIFSFLIMKSEKKIKSYIVFFDKNYKNITK